MKRPNWKFWLLIALKLAFAGLFLFIPFIGFYLWLNIVLIPLVIGLFASAFIALYFTIKTEREKLHDRLSREINAVFEKCLKLQEELYTISYFPFYSGSVKKVMLHRTLLTMPEMYAINDNYKELWDLYKKNTSYIIEEILKFPDNEVIERFNDNSVEFGLAIHEIVDCTLRVQERFLQDFKIKPKGAIENQLIFRVNAPSDNSLNKGFIVDMIKGREKRDSK